MIHAGLVALLAISEYAEQRCGQFAMILTRKTPFMNIRVNVPVLLAGLTVSAALGGCGQAADQNATPNGAASGSDPSPNALPTNPAAEARKNPNGDAPAPGASAPAVIDQPASPTVTPADAAKDKAKSGDGTVKPETAPKGA